MFHYLIGSVKKNLLPHVCKNFQVRLVVCNSVRCSNEHCLTSNNGVDLILICPFLVQTPNNITMSLVRSCVVASSFDRRFSFFKGNLISHSERRSTRILSILKEVIADKSISCVYESSQLATEHGYVTFTSDSNSALQLALRLTT